MEPWGISGPQFLGLYACALVVAVVATIVLRHRRARVRTVRPQPELPVEEMAYLSGGRVRAVDAAVAGLIERDVLRVQRGGFVRLVNRGKPETELETAIVGLVRRWTRTPIKRIRRELVGSRAVDRIRRSLEEQGLLVPSGFGAAIVSAAPLLVVAAIGIVRLVNGVALDRPVAFLAVLLVVTAVLVVVFLRRPTRWLTSTGKTTRSSLHRARAGRHVPTGALAGAAAVVALGGIAAYPDSAIAEQLRQQGGAGSSGGSGGACSSGGSCGSSSSSSCGGGGGGCGG